MRIKLEPINIGHRQETRNHGWLEVVEKESSMRLLVRFDNTGSVQKAHLANLRKNLVSDQSLSLRSTFIDKAISLYGEGSFDYSKVNYTNRDGLVDLHCNTHNIDFTQTPRRHLKGQTGCPKCSTEARSKSARLTIEEFVERATELHKGLYDYTKTVYSRNNEDVVITCPIHGDFLQKPQVHLFGCGCQLCANARTGAAQTKDVGTFIEEAREVHGDKYDYSLVEYKKAVQKVKIICPEHGVFEQTPIGHITGRGCHKCAKTGFNEHKDGLLYVLNNGQYIKVGITNKTTEHRVKQLNNTAPYKFWEEFCIRLDGASCKKIEKQMHIWLEDCGHKRPNDRFVGWTECFVGPSVVSVINKVCELVDEHYG